MIDGDELDRRARTVAQDIKNCGLYDTSKMQELLAQAKKVRQDFVKWVNENSV